MAMNAEKRYDTMIQKFLSTEEDHVTDFLKRENSNYVYSLPLLRKNITNAVEEAYLMRHILPKRLVDLYEEGVVYIHDKQLSSYCQSISCKDIASYGIPSLAKNMLESGPASSLSTLIRHFSNVVTLMSQQVSGAVMLSQMTTVLASYLYDEEQRGIYTDDASLFKLLYQLVYELNLPLRSGSESAFSNCTLEFGKPSEEIKDELVIIGGEGRSYYYKDIESQYFDRINKAFIDAMAKGTLKGIPLTFPLITVQVDNAFNFNNTLFHYLLEKMYHWGGVYFENFQSEAFNHPHYRKLNPQIKPKDPSVSRSLCCRLNIDLTALSASGGGIFGSSVGNVGAIQVLNLNMNRLFLEFGHDLTLLKIKMKEYLDIMQEGHMAKRRFIEQNKELYPTFFAFNNDLRNYFNVFAITGMHEGIMNYGIKEGLNSESGRRLAHDIMQTMTSIVSSYIKRDNVACGIEYAPAENAGIRLARKDKAWAEAHRKKIVLQGTGDDVYLTSGCMLPFSEEDFTKQIENAAEFQAYATSGSILHHFLEDIIPPQQLSIYIKNLFQKPINYITLTPTLTSCLACGCRIVAADAHSIQHCPTCNSDDLASYSRVIGYVRMIARKQVTLNQEGLYEGTYNFWSKARRIDWASRKKLNDSHLYDSL